MIAITTKQTDTIPAGLPLRILLDQVEDYDPVLVDHNGAAVLLMPGSFVKVRSFVLLRSRTTNEAWEAKGAFDAIPGLEFLAPEITVRAFGRFTRRGGAAVLLEGTETCVLWEDSVTVRIPGKEVVDLLPDGGEILLTIE